MADQLRLGVVGASPGATWAARTHMPALVTLPEFQLAAVCTTRQESAEAAAREYEADKAYWDYHDLVADPNVDVVDVCVRVPFHHEITMAALEAGKHVYCEWPLGATTAQAEEMASAAEKRGLHTMVGLQARAAPSVMYLRQLIQDGYVGRVVVANMMQINGGLFADLEPSRAWRVDREKGAHTLSISTGHSLDGFLWCVGQLTELSGIVDTLAPEIGVKGEGMVQVTSPDHVIVTGRLEDGGLATVEIGSVPYHGAGFRMEIYGTEGTIVATAPNQLQATGVKLQGAKKGEEKLSDLQVPAELRWTPTEVPNGTPVNLAQMMRRFAEGIQKGTNPGPTFAEAVRNHRLLDAIVESSETGRRVQVTQK